jgi:ubiquinone biosynthesis protein UbiJ
MSADTLSSAIFIRAVNHLLSSESWARERLAKFPQKVAYINAVPIEFLFVVDQDGLLETLEISESPDVSIALSGDWLMKAISGQAGAVLASAKISGSADFAEALSFVFKNLRWDAEADLSAWIGDIPARRGLQTLRQCLAWQRDASVSFIENVKEFLVEESRQLIGKNEVNEFGRAVSILRDDLARLEQRVSRT